MKNFSQRDRNAVWHPFTSLKSEDPIIHVVRGDGVNLYTADGRTIIDAVSSWWVNLHGHANQKIAEAVAKQAATLEHVIFAGFTHEPAVVLAENLLQILPPNQRKIFFSDDGSTAVEVALKMALQYWRNQGQRRTRIIALDGAYHGDTFGAMSVGERGLFTAAFSPLLFDTSFVGFPTASNEDHVYESFKQLIDEQDVAAFIYEPLLQGAAGMRMYSASFLNRLLQYAQANHVLCIADEVLTGFGRTGKPFASDYMSTKPDIMALSKGLTGGTLPLSVTTCSEKILDAFTTDDTSKTFYHGHSYTANPIACAAANASFELFTDPQCQRNIARIAAQHEQFKLKTTGHPQVIECRTLGTVLALEVRTHAETSYTNALRKKIYDYFLDVGILLRPLGNVIYVLPPYVITADQLEFIYQKIESFLDSL